MNEQKNYTTDYQGYTLIIWLIDGYGWVGEIRDQGFNIMPDWMNSRGGSAWVAKVTDDLIANIDSHLAQVKS